MCHSVQMEISGLLSALGVGIMIGVFGRVLTPNMAPIGCILTVIIGVVGALLGSLVGVAAGWGFWATFAIQVLIATILVSIVAALSRPRQP